MATSRYRKSQPLEGKFIFKMNQRTKRKKNVVYYNSMRFTNLSDASLGELEIQQITFKKSDTLMGLAQRYYDSPSYWWVIALINNIGSEADIAVGQQLTIAAPLSALLPELNL